jgi:hypothetical protein
MCAKLGWKEASFSCSAHVCDEACLDGLEGLASAISVSLHRKESVANPSGEVYAQPGIFQAQSSAACRSKLITGGSHFGPE